MSERSGEYGTVFRRPPVWCAAGEPTPTVSSPFPESLTPPCRPALRRAAALAGLGGVRDGTAFGPEAPQSAELPGAPVWRPADEDILSVNAWPPGVRSLTNCRSSSGSTMRPTPSGPPYSPTPTAPHRPMPHSSSSAATAVWSTRVTGTCSAPSRQPQAARPGGRAVPGPGEHHGMRRRPHERHPRRALLRRQHGGLPTAMERTPELFRRAPTIRWPRSTPTRRRSSSPSWTRRRCRLIR
jgi:hypothetical protein